MQSFSFQEDIILFQYFEEETHNYLRTSTGNNPSFLARKIYAKDRKRERLLLCFIVRQTIKFSCRKSTREEKKKYLDKREFRRDNSESELWLKSAYHTDTRHPLYLSSYNWNSQPQQQLQLSPNFQNNQKRRGIGTIFETQSFRGYNKNRGGRHGGVSIGTIAY